MSLTSGARVRQHSWTKMPMPAEVINRVNAIGLRQKMPTKLTYANRYGQEIEDTIDELQYDSSDDESSFAPSDSDSSSFDSDDESMPDSDDDDNDHHNNAYNLPPLPDGMGWIQIQTLTSMKDL